MTLSMFVLGAELDRVHRDPVTGSVWYRERGAAGDPSLDDLRARPWTDFVPASVLATESLLVVESGGTTGRPIAVAFTAEGFRANFVAPFLAALGPAESAFRHPWLFVGPSGPHAIGRGAEGSAVALTGQTPSSVDMDPRWLKRCRPGVVRDRYLDHVVDQALDVLASRAIGVLFSTPPLLTRLGEAMAIEDRDRILAIHWGGVAATVLELGRIRELYPQAELVAGFGNSLVGLFPQIGESGGLPVYGHLGGSHFFRVVDQHGSAVRDGESGRLVVGRRDLTLWMSGVVERDLVVSITTRDGRKGFQPAPAPAPIPGLEVIY